MVIYIDPIEFLIVFVGLGVPFILVLLFVFIDMKGSKKSMFIYFKSKKIAELAGNTVADGMVQIGKKRFFVDAAMPPSIRMGLLIKSFRPLYVIKHDRAIPYTLAPDKPSGAERSPENMKNLMENKTLDQLLTPKNGGGLSLIAGLIGMVIGLLLMYVLFAAKVIQLA